MLVQKTRNTSKITQMAQIALADWFVKTLLICVIFDKNLFGSGLSRLGNDP